MTAGSPAPVVVGIDVGGTFTDAIVLSARGYASAKVPSTPEDQSVGVIEAVGALLAASAGEADGVASIMHGTTIATNALLERKGARTAFVTTAGFRDLLVLARQTRPHLYDLARRPPEPVAPPELAFEVDERQSAGGVLKPLTRESVAAVVEQLRSADVEAVAVCLLFAYADSSPEQEVAAALRTALPDAVVVASHELVPEFREYERAVTTSVDAYLGPTTSRYLRKLGAACASTALPEPEIMQSSGGVASLADASAHAARLILSGPAGGIVGARAVAEALGLTDVVTLDMGGTSTDVGVIRDGSIGRSPGLVVGGLPIRLPSIDIHTVGAGGGSIAWLDSGGALRVGPESAGATPGPACYGRGGIEPTVTDADLVLGYLDESQPLSGLSLDRGAALSALGRLDAGFDSPDALAEGIFAVANAEMGRAIRVVTIEKGLDARDYHLLAFGGAGPLHAVALADELDMRGVIVPAAPGVLSALGLALSDRRFDMARSVLRSLGEFDEHDLRATIEALARQSPRPPDLVEVYCDLRYLGQSFELEVPYEVGESLAHLERRFHEAHEVAYGFTQPASGVELVSVRVAARELREPVDLDHASPAGLDRGRRPVVWRGERTNAQVFAGVGVGRLRGPAIVDLGNATCLVPPGWTATQVRSIGLVIER
jgi:N-methylhydantoinase A